MKKIFATSIRKETERLILQHRAYYIVIQRYRHKRYVSMSYELPFSSFSMINGKPPLQLRCFAASRGYCAHNHANCTPGLNQGTFNNILLCKPSTYIIDIACLKIKNTPNRNHSFNRMRVDFRLLKFSHKIRSFSTEKK